MTAHTQLVRLQRWTLDEKRQKLAELERLAARLRQELEEFLEQTEGFVRGAVLEAESAVRQARIQYGFGLVAYVNVISIQDRHVAAQRQLIALRNSRLANRINLYLALGVDYATGAGQTSIAATGPEEE